MQSVLNPLELAKKLKVSTGTIYNWLNKRKIPYIKINGAVRFDEKKIESWLNRRSVATTIGGRKFK